MAELYPVNETFLSWQGEGVHLGRKAFFIRLQGEMRLVRLRVYLAPAIRPEAGA
jgi:hypothetical protein